jgi:hypothetical protein
MVVLLSMGTALAEEGPVGLIKNFKGQAAVERGGEMLAAEEGLKLNQGDVIVTGADSAMGIIMRDNSVVSVGPDSRLELTEFVFNPAEKKMSFVSKMAKGTAVYLTGLIAKLDNRAMRVETPTAVCGVRGTRFAVSVKGE